IQQFESHVIQPVVMSRAVSLHPAVVVFALLIMSTLFGFVGLLLAIPLVAAIHVLVRELWISRMDTMGVDPSPPEEAPQKRPKSLPSVPSKRLSRIWRAVRSLLRS
ncbi:MAG: AI-2E family transporter, partial [Rubrobacter sp.]|nr:AI-2E family transporter [Rubrobacter sp.]